VADLSDLRRLADDLGRGARPPAFEDLQDRAAARRRRQAGGAAALAAVVLIGGAGVLSTRDDRATPPPAVDRPSPTATPTTDRSGDPRPAWDPASVVADGVMIDAAASGDGRVLSVWRACSSGARCHYAWRLMQGTDVVATGAAPGATGGLNPRALATADAFLLVTDRVYVVRADGSLDTPTAVASGRIGAVDGVVGLLHGSRVVDPDAGTTWPLPMPPEAMGTGTSFITPDGTVWALPLFSGEGRVEVARLRDSTWTTHRVDDPTSTAEIPAYLAVSGDHVAALTSYDGATVSPVGRLEVSTDGGASWASRSAGQLPFDTVDSMAATSGGVLFLSEPGGRLWRSADDTWTRFERVPSSGPVTVYSPAGDTVLLKTSQDRLALVDSAGTITPVRAR
jgi:hypothetical protein